MRRRDSERVEPATNPPNVLRDERRVLREEQRQLLRLMAEGLPDIAIARRLALGPRTLARRVADLYDLLGVDTRFQAGVAAQRQGLLDDHPSDHHPSHPHRTTGTRRPTTAPNTPTRHPGYPRLHPVR
jgi:DNA-binding CsgD family transcriptional regulator